MKRIDVILTFLLVLFAATARSEVVVTPATLVPGGVARVSWAGEPGIRQLQVLLDGQPLPVCSQGEPPFALVGIDLTATAAERTLTVIATDLSGRTTEETRLLRVIAEPRPSERLTLPKQMATPTEPKILRRIERDSRRVAQAYAPRSAPLRWLSFALPVDGEVRSVFGLRRILNGVEKSPHNGIDFRAPAGTPVTAAGDGRVVLAEELYYTGLTVIVDHGGGLFSLYAHLQSLAVAVGKEVERGALLGAVGSTGRSTGPHLHYGMRLGTARIDPLALLQLYGVSTPAPRGE